jgi:integral membrane protein (TIGR00529 family)
MSDILKITAVFIIILILLRKKLNIGYVMLIASGVLAIFYLMSPLNVLSTIKAALSDKVTIKLAIALTLIRSFELILRENNVLSDMMNASKILLRRKKAVIVSMPMLIGLLPSVGGAYFSAPMVDESTKDMKMSQEEKAFINYWFRHPWEYILPLYPGILLASAISNIELRDLIVANTSYAVFIAITGFIFSMRGATGKFRRMEGVSKRGLLSFVPIAAVLLLVVIFHMELHYALLMAILVLFVVYRYKLKDIFRVFRHGLSLDVIVLILGIMIFKEMMESSGAVKNLSTFLTTTGVPFVPILFLLPFLTGILTGLTVGFVGSTFPLILSIAGTTSISIITFAFASGFIGVLLSPVHICLVLTREYFKADMWGVYKRIVPAGFIVFLVAIVEYLILR